MEQVPKPRDSHFFQIPSWLSLKHGPHNSKDSKFEQNDDSSFQKKLSEEVKKLKAKKERLDPNVIVSKLKMSDHFFEIPHITTHNKIIFLLM